MADTQKTKKGMHPGVAAAAGAVISVAGVAVAAAFAHEPTRKKMSKTLQDAKMKVGSTVKDLQKSSKPIIKKAQDKMKKLTDTMHVEKSSIKGIEETAHQVSTHMHSHMHGHGDTTERVN